MKKKIPSGIFVTAFAAAMFLVIYRNKRISKSGDSSILYPIQLRLGSERNQSDGLLIKQKSETLFDQVRKQPTNPRPYLQLVSLYLQEARMTGKFSYYYVAALKCIGMVLKSDPANYDALTFKAMILLSQHHFEEGLELAEQLVKVNPYNSFVYGLLVDGYVEMGNYNTAVECADKMVSIRPDMRSYSRIAYLVSAIA
jgi:tetratricopeptide (TPR) repeat protein